MFETVDIHVRLWKTLVIENEYDTPCIVEVLNVSNHWHFVNHNASQVHHKEKE